MIIKFLKDKHTYKTGEEVEVEQTIGSALVCAGVASVVKFDAPTLDHPKAVMEKKKKTKSK